MESLLNMCSEVLWSMDNAMLLYIVRDCAFHERDNIEWNNYSLSDC